ISVYEDLLTFNADGTFSGTTTNVTGTWQLTDNSALEMTYDDTTYRAILREQSGEHWFGIVWQHLRDGEVVAQSAEWAFMQQQFTQPLDTYFANEEDEFWNLFHFSWQAAKWDFQNRMPIQDNGVFGFQFLPTNDAYTFSLSSCPADATIESCYVDDLSDYSFTAMRPLGVNSNGLFEFVQSENEYSGQRLRYWLPIFENEELNIVAVMEYSIQV